MVGVLAVRGGHERAGVHREFRRYDVRPGQTMQIAVVADAGDHDGTDTVPSFFDSFDGPADLAERCGEILGVRPTGPNGR